MFFPVAALSRLKRHRQRPYVSYERKQVYAVR